MIGEILKSTRRGDWDDQFDARASQGDKVASNMPIFSPQRSPTSSRPSAQYSSIVAQGGWPMVPATKKLRLGVADPDVVLLRKRLMVSGDLSQSAGISKAFDTYVDGAVKRFQARHGLPADGVLGEYPMQAMNMPRRCAPRQLDTNIVRLQSMSGDLGGRYVMVNIPAAYIEAVENGRVALRHTAVVGKISRPTPILNSKINEVILNPYWNAPRSIVEKDIVPLMRKDPEYLKKNRSASSTAGQRGCTRDDRLECRKGAEPDVPPGSGQDQRHGLDQDQLPQRAQRLHARHAAAGPVQQARPLRMVGLRARTERPRPDDLAAARHARLVASANRGDDQSGENSPIQLAEEVPVYFKYITAWAATDGIVQFRDDIYQTDGEQELALQTTTGIEQAAGSVEEDRLPQ